MTKTDVVIIGAGIAGVGAAKELSDLGIKCLILEADTRIGGRVYSVPFGEGHRSDLGASWIHGLGPGAGVMRKYDRMTNPVYDIAVQEGI